MKSPRTLATTLLPADQGLDLGAVEVAGERIVARLISTSPERPCPACGTLSRAVHSRYGRTVADLPWGRFAVRVHLAVRKFFCRQAACPRRIFTERLPTVAVPYARRTVRLTEVVRLLAFALGGEPGARVVGRLGMAASPATLLRLIRDTDIAEAPTPRALGVDDWARRRGHRYGTILVDLERQRIVDLLPDRTAETLAAWLDGRPGVAVVSRDRSGAYADGVARGAPAALQVADRFHLARNMGEALDRCFDRHRAAIKAVERPAPSAAPDGEAPVPFSPAPPRPDWEAQEERRRAARQARYDVIRARYLRGASIAELARDLRLNWRTVRKYAQAERCPERRPSPPRPRLLAPYEPYLRRRWAEGCHNAMRLHREIVAQGFGGSRIHVARFVAPFRRPPAADPSAAATDGRAAARGLTPRDATWLVLRRAADRAPAEQAALEQLRRLAPQIERAVTLGERFLALLRERPGDGACDRWVAEADVSGIPELRHFAIKLKQDLPACRAACREPWSNGQTEGQVHKLKLLKRSMYGRAKFDLLRQRLLYAA